MNCDQAFDAMTGPDRPHSRDLSQHLQCCSRCRQMYETLEPALGLFASVDGDPAAGFPTALAGLGSAPARMAQRLAAKFASTGTGSRPVPKRRRLWGAVLAASVAGFLLSVGLGPYSQDSPTGLEGPTSGCTWLHRESVSDGVQAESLVATCLECHTSPSNDTERQQSSLQEFSRELEQLVAAWHAAVGPVRPSQNVLIARTSQGGRTHA